MPEETVDPDEPDPRPGRRRPSRRTITLISIPMITLWVMSLLGQAFSPDLVKEHPAWLLALNPQIRYMVLVSNQLDAFTYYSVGLLRLVISDPLWFLVGYWYGDAAVEWMERRTRTWGEMLRTGQKWFGKAAYPLIFIAPNNFICLFAGAAGIPLRRFLIVNITGTIARLYLVRRFADLFDDTITEVLDWIGDNRKFLLPITIGLTVLSLLLEWRKGETEGTALAHLDDEIEEMGTMEAEDGDSSRSG